MSEKSDSRLPDIDDSHSNDISKELMSLSQSWESHLDTDRDTLKKDITTFCKNIRKKIVVLEQSARPDIVTKEGKTLKDLLVCIKENNKVDVQDFIELFPRPADGVKNSDGHVFEALWILIFLFKYDDLIEVGYTRQLYKNIESMDKDNRKT